MNDKFMCLCFPEFSGKYVYDVMCFYPTFPLLRSLPSGTIPLSPEIEIE